MAFFGQPVALVVATTFKQARAAAGLVAITYQREDGAFDLDAYKDRDYAPKSADADHADDREIGEADRFHVPETANTGLPADSAIGDLDRAMAQAAVTVDATCTTPHHFSQAMEPQACLAG